VSLSRPVGPCREMQHDQSVTAAMLSALCSFSTSLASWAPALAKAARRARPTCTASADCRVNWRGLWTGLESLDTNAGSLMHN